ncbi:hypothetical protein [Iodidimonas nitroreducens]|uniref:hypothetical protein n=1 Tax=Iodidimonas nitroreducens TaxID=1236968 RepID=UPI001378FD62|nr:hypothetical protein [Iodidimonas nitroreducens]
MALLSTILVFVEVWYFDFGVGGLFGGLLAVGYLYYREKKKLDQNSEKSLAKNI